jgi:hypothetical protein
MTQPILCTLLVAMCTLLVIALHRAVVSRETTSVMLDATRVRLAQTEHHVDTLTADLHTARERLVQAWKDGYTVPTTIAEDLLILFLSIIFSQHSFAQWRRVDAPQDRIFSIARHDNKLFAASEDTGVWMSDNGGQSWYRVNS